MSKAVRCCAPAFKAQLAKAPAGAPVLAMGKHAIAALGLRAKTGTGRGFVRQLEGRLGIVTWHPSFAILREPKHHGAFSIDLQRFARLIAGICYWQPPPVNTNPTAHDLIALAKADRILGCDIETGPESAAEPWTGKDPLRARLKTIAFATENAACALQWRGDGSDVEVMVAAMLADSALTKVFHNGYYFDIPVLERHGMIVR